MKKHVVVHVLGQGNMARVARLLGITKQAVQCWPVDEYDNITSRRVVDAILAAMVRLNHEHRLANPGEERYEYDEETLADLMRLPQSETETE